MTDGVGARGRASATPGAGDEPAPPGPGRRVRRAAGAARSCRCCSHTLERPRTRGWRVGAVFPEGAQRSALGRGLHRDRVTPRFAAVEGRSAPGQMAARPSCATNPGPTILHTHFTLWDVPAALAARRLDRAAVIWHVHTTLGKTPASVLRNVAKFASLGRGVAAILCPAPNIADDVRRRLAPRGESTSCRRRSTSRGFRCWTTTSASSAAASWGSHRRRRCCCISAGTGT